MINSQSVRIIFISSLLVFLMIEVSRAAEIPMTLADCIATAVRENRAIKNVYLDRVYSGDIIQIPCRKMSLNCIMYP